MIKIGLVFKYLFLRRDFFQFNFLLSIFGISIGVASLFVSMAVFSGYETTLKQSIFDREGHITLFESRKSREKGIKGLDFFKEWIPDLEGITPFFYTESLILHKKKLSGVLLHGIELKSLNQVLNFQNKLIQGELDFGESHSDFDVKKNSKQEIKRLIFGAFIGKTLAQKNNLRLGEIFRVVLPKRKAQEGSRGILPYYLKFKVQAIMDFGRFDYNERSLIVNHSSFHRILSLDSLTTGYHIKMKDPDQSSKIAENINAELSPFYWARDWKESEKTLFEVVQLEKKVIFLILCLMVLAAGFNVSNALFVSVMERSRDISLFKTLGGRNWFILSVFSLQGLLAGVFGVLLGIGLGLMIGEGFIYAQEKWHILASDVYKLESIDLEFRAADFFWITFVSLFVCFFATLFPAYRGTKFLPAEGLRYE